MTDPPLSRVTRHIATRKEAADHPGARAAAIQRAEYSKWWLVTYACGAVRFQPATLRHEISTWCPEHQSELIDTAVQLSAKAWAAWRAGLDMQRDFTASQWALVVAKIEA